ncbi:hypothetical protein K490DRAFT_44110 [Saccharata proteae CBS 121410]|uniref:Non-structural maintenance of chromosomes element 4 n=1 Tax=Saccharata proteae CBS 121410 TaxID=1314787 RepID=A0A9P4HRC8_9PEZI|nr:hypothetical protein K490DRAFT_44110 [Saccharata proteae CBS 121410]
MGGRVIDPTQYYDPDQDQDQRREVVKDMRLLTRDFQDRRDDLAVKDISTFLSRSNQNMNRVKQTSDATIDSRFLVAASDLVTKKTAELVLGDAGTRIDIDEFVSKCVTFMRSGGLNGPDDDGLEPPSTQARARRRTQRADAHSDDEDDEDNGDALAWDVLGEQACFPSNRRPPVPGFLLGPLSKRPDTLKPQDLQQAENSNLVTVVKGLKKKLQDVVEARMDAVEEELGSFIEDPTDEQIEAVAGNHRLIRNEEGDPEIPLLEWVVNPNSFGQTVENLFYTSFLIREGNAAIGKDKRGLPTLRPADPRSLNEQHQQQVQKNQAILSIDYPTWQTFIRALDLREPIIPHRNDEQATQAVRGWYG